MTREHKALDACGVEIRVGDRVWDVLGNRMFEVLDIDGEGRLGEYVVKTKGADGIGLTGWSRPCDLTHHRPVTGADGRPLREGETVWDKDTGDRFEVNGSSDDGFVVCWDLDRCEADIEIKPSQLIHERPDIWERLEEDVANASCPDVYCANRHIDASDTSYEWAMARDIVRRAKALAGVS